jgi:hypothetical protein
MMLLLLDIFLSPSLVFGLLPVAIIAPYGGVIPRKIFHYLLFSEIGLKARPFFVFYALFYSFSRSAPLLRAVLYSIMKVR